MAVIAGSSSEAALSAPAVPPGSRAAIPSAARFYRPELDLLRLAAFGMVWSAHALLSFHSYLPERLLAIAEGVGSCGVPIFFFLSAYLITELLRREQLRTGRLQLRLFYMRRVLRIWPLYLGVLAAYGLLGLRFHGFRIENGRLLASVLLLGNWYLVFHPAILTPMRALWSVSVEEQWYLFFPLLHRSLPRRSMLLLCLLLFATAQGWLFSLARHSAGSALHVTAWVHSGVQFQFFALGTAAALLLDGFIPKLSAALRWTLFASAALLLLFAAGVCRFKEALPAHSAASLISAYLLIGTATACSFFALLGIRPERCPRRLVRLGQLSFGLYVFHETGFFLASALMRHARAPSSVEEVSLEKLLSLALTILLAWVSYHAWELPFLRLKQRWTVVASRQPE